MATAATNVTNATAVTAVSVDYLGYVRDHLAHLPPASWARYQADAGVSLRTLYNIRDSRNDPAYGTVLKVYESIKKFEAQAGAQ